MEKTIVITSDDYEGYECYTDGGYWNGFAVVYMTRAQLAAWLDSTPYDYRFLEAHEAWNTRDNPVVIIYFENEETIEAINEDGMELFPLEGFEFMYHDEWSELDPKNQDK